MLVQAFKCDKNGDLVETRKDVKIYDYVCFKCDVEQAGQIVAIKNGMLKLYSEYGFHGDYIGGARYTEQRAIDCWVEE